MLLQYTTCIIKLEVCVLWFCRGVTIGGWNGEKIGELCGDDQIKHNDEEKRLQSLQVLQMKCTFVIKCF